MFMFLTVTMSTLRIHIPRAVNILCLIPTTIIKDRWWHRPVTKEKWKRPGFPPWSVLSKVLTHLSQGFWMSPRYWHWGVAFMTHFKTQGDMVLRVLRRRKEDGGGSERWTPQFWRQVSPPAGTQPPLNYSELCFVAHFSISPGRRPYVNIYYQHQDGV